MSSKRPLGPPSGNTPNKPPKKSARRRAGTPRKSLIFNASELETSTNTCTNNASWDEKEISALVQFIALYHEGDGPNVWPSHKQKDFWDRCTAAVSEYSGLPQRSGNACRRKVQRHLSAQFQTLDEAEEFYKIDYFEGQDLAELSTVSSTPMKESDNTDARISSCLSPVFHQSSYGEKEMATGDLIKVMTDGFLKMTSLQRVQFLSFLFSKYLCYDIGVVGNFVPTDFVKLAACSFKNLQAAGVGNTVYFLVQSIGTMRSDGTSPRMPLDRMPFGLIHHNLEFFAKENPTNLHPIDHYAEWQTTMFAHFGHKWDRLFRGPMWSYDGETSEEEDDKSSAATSHVGADVSQSLNVTEGLSELITGVDGNALCEDATPTATSHVEAGVYNEDLLSQAVNITEGLAELITGVDDSASCEHAAPTATSHVEAGVSNADLLSQAVNITEGLAELITGVDGNVSFEDAAPCPEFSSLWSGLSTSDRADLEQASVLPQDIEELHNVRPKRSSKRGKAKKDPMKAKVNVAGLSARQLRRRIQQKGFTRDTNIQVEALKTAQRRNPSGRWWIKADACDMRAGVRESMRHEWSGDVDLGDGQLNALHQRYMALLDFVKGIGLNRRKSFAEIVKDLRQLLGTLQDDAVFLEVGLRQSTETYDKKRKQNNVAESNLFALAWDVNAYETLKALNIEMSGRCQELINRCLGTISQRGNIPSSLSKLRKDVQVYTKDVFSKRREAATHLMVFMIADERRDMKPYAIPVRALPFKSIKDAKLRELRDELKVAMENLGMVVVGFVTDGEFNSLRTQGSQRPVSIIQLIMDARKEANSISFRRIEQFLQPKHVGDAIEPKELHPAVPKDDVVKINSLLEQGVPFERAILLLRRTHFPSNYEPHPWKTGLPENKSDCLKSLMATYLFRKKVNDFTAMGVNFKKHLYVPEKNPISGEFFHEREDHNHVLKRITTCAREGCIPLIGLQYFRDALHDDKTGLTYEALTGKRKQSVPDCEKFFSIGVLKYMEDNKHENEAKVVKTVLNWHKANDGRGLDEETRKKYNMTMLNWILEDWMPWYKDCRDFSTLDVNRSIKGIQGLTREIIVALVANLESKEHRREEGKSRGLPPENPRAGTTDDVEGIISLFHELLGPIFDHKTFKEQFPKIMSEFNKRIDPDLPFYYWTGVNERFHLKALPSFNEPSPSGIERLDRVIISRRADPGVFVANRASLPQRGSLTVRATFHAVSETLPPRIV